MAFGHFLLGSHSFMVTALGSCVKWSSTTNFLSKVKFKDSNSYSAIHL
jgi:hypothetical protein